MSSDNSLSKQIQTYHIFLASFSLNDHTSPTHITKHFQLYGVTLLYVFPLVVHRIVLRFLLQFFLSDSFLYVSSTKKWTKRIISNNAHCSLLPYDAQIFHFNYYKKRKKKRVSSQKAQNEIMSTFPIQSPLTT